MFDKLRYDDLKEAHENSIIPVVDDERNIKHKTVHELEKERSIKTATLSSEESNKILHSKYERTEQQGSTFPSATIPRILLSQEKLSLIG